MNPIPTHFPGETSVQKVTKAMKSRSSSFLSLYSIVAITMVQSVTAANGTWGTTILNWSDVIGPPWDAANGPGNTATVNTASLAALVNGPCDTVTR